MTKIILKFKDAVLKEIPVEKELITIGRKPDNDIEIDNLAVSGHHARIFKAGDWFLIEDLDSLKLLIYALQKLAVDAERREVGIPKAFLKAFEEGDNGQKN